MDSVCTLHLFTRCSSCTGQMEFIYLESETGTSQKIQHHLLDLFNLNHGYLKSDGHEHRHEEPKCRKGGGSRMSSTDYEDMEWDTRVCETPKFNDNNNEIVLSIPRSSPNHHHPISCWNLACSNSMLIS